MASPLPTLQYLVAFQNNAYDDPALITSVASPGVLGANNVWTDITSFVASHTFDRGRQHELSQFEAGKCDLVLNNRDGRFSPYNTSSPYTGFLTVRKLFQIRQTWSGVTYTRFTGLVDAWPTDWPDQTSQWCTLHVSDAFRAFNLADITTGGYPAQVIADGAVNYWRLGDLAGTSTATDSAGSNPETIGFGVAFGVTPGALPANVGTAASFVDSASGIPGAQSIPVTADGLGASPSAASVEFWFQIPTGATGVFLAFFVPFGTGGKQFSIQYTTSGTSLFGQLTGNINGCKYVHAFEDSTWHHYVYTTTGGTGSGDLLYIDGVQVATATNLGAPSAVNFPGFGTEYGVGSPSFNMQEVAIYPTALSAAKVLNHYNLAAFAQESTDARIGRVLNAINWSSGARALDAGKATVQKVTTSLTSTSSLSHMQQVEGTEGGALFMTGDGKVKFLSRTTLQGNSLYTSSQQKIGDNTAGGDMPFQPSPQLALDDIDLYNEAVATRTGGVTQIYSNSTSITNNGRVTWNPPTTLLGIADSEVLALIQYIVSKFATPVVRVQSVTVDLLELITPNIVANLLSLDLLYQVTVERTVTPDGGTAFSQTANIERIHEQVTPDSWKVTFQLAKADPSWWILGTSQLGTQTALAW